MEFEQQNSTKSKVIAGSIIALIVVALLAAIVVYEAKKHHLASDILSPTSSLNGNPTTPTVPAGTTFKDGTYTASSNYYVPHGMESIDVTLTVKNNVVTNSQIQNSEGNPESAGYQEAFASQYQSDVVGKNLGSIQISYIAGASDTTQGFDDALQSIINQAKA